MTYAQHPHGRISGLRPAELRDLSPGRTLYLRDPRQTPVTVVGTDPETASVTLRVGDFEDRGALWTFALWEVEKFQSPPEGPVLSASEVASLGRNIPALNRQITIGCDPESLARTTAEIAQRVEESARELEAENLSLPQGSADILQREVLHDGLSRALVVLLDRRGLGELEACFSRDFASNPHASEMIKAHRLVLADLGLCPFEGAPLRDPAWLAPPWDSARRRDHIVTRLAFLRLVFSRAGLERLPLYRTVYAAGGITPPVNRGFVSATFRQSVALDLLEAGKAAGQAALYWQEVSAERVFMTFLETPELSARYAESEAVLIWGAGVF